MHGTARQRLHARLAHGADWTVLRLDGVIDEHNGLEHLLAQPHEGRPTLLIDLGGVRRINSVGVRDWVVWLRGVRERFPTVVLFDCPPAIVTEINLVRNFAQGAIVTTFQAPYFCDRCELESVQTLDAVAMVKAGDRKAPPQPCGKPACANALDDADESYFAFFEDLDGRAIPGDLDAKITAARAALAGPSGAPADAAAARPALGSLAIETRHPPAQRGHEAPGRDRSSVPPGGTSSSAANAPAAGATQPPRDRPSQDVAFIVVLVLMLAVLGVLVYLIATLE